jgi:hypothetical protein
MASLNTIGEALASSGRPNSSRIVNQNHVLIFAHLSIGWECASPTDMASGYSCGGMACKGCPGQPRHLQARESRCLYGRGRVEGQHGGVKMSRAR